MQLLRTLPVPLSWLRWGGQMWFVPVERTYGGVTIRSTAV